MQHRQSEDMFEELTVHAHCVFTECSVLGKVAQECIKEKKHKGTHQESWGRFRVMLPLILSPKLRYPTVAREMYKTVTIAMPMFKAFENSFLSLIWFSRGRTYNKRHQNKANTIVQNFVLQLNWYFICIRKKAIFNLDAYTSPLKKKHNPILYFFYHCVPMV